jgi:Domain of unknown function (DUF4440)
MLANLLIAIVSAGVLGQPAFGQSARSASSKPVDASGSAAEVLALEQKIEEAVVRGDVAFVDSVTPSDFSFVHGDGWTRGDRPLMSDDKAAFLKRVADKEYIVHDLDNVKVELHGDVAITYGRYVSLFLPNRTSANPGRLNSIWFERVYAKRNGKWEFLSHRTVHGPTASPAGVDPTTATSRPGSSPR